VIAEASTAAPAPRPSKAEIHDLGYQRYSGPRRTTSARWRVIAREQLASAWKTWWRWKTALALATIVTCTFAGIMFLSTGENFRGMVGAALQVLSKADAMLPISIEWFCRVGCFISLVLGAVLVASDLESESFTFYVARSVRPRDYIAGKLVGYAIIVASVVAVGPLVLAGVRIGLADTTDELIANLWLVPRALLIGGVATVAYTAVPLGFSALVRNRRHALALWASYYLVLGSAVVYVNFETGSRVVALDLSTCVAAVALDVFDVHPMWGRREKWHLSPEIAIVSIALQAVIAIAIVWWRVAREQKRGVGGAA
jgi:hypothetical protein